MSSGYAFAEYSSDWSVQFSREAEFWQHLLRDDIVAIHHIGSTAVPGLAAKPVIDLLPVVRDIDRVDHHTAELEAAGNGPVRK